MKKALEKIYIVFVVGFIVCCLYFTGCFSSLDGIINVAITFIQELLKIFLSLLLLIVLAFLLKPVRKFVFKIEDKDVQE